MSIKVTYRDGVFAPLEKVAGVQPGAIYTAFSKEELRDILMETAGTPVNLIREEAVELGVTADGFYGVEWLTHRPFRWTDGKARLSVPIDPRSPPSAMTVDVLMTDGLKKLRIKVDSHTLFNEVIKNRWTETFTLDVGRLTSPKLEIELLSDTHVPQTRDNRTLGVAVGAIELGAGRPG